MKIFTSGRGQGHTLELEHAKLRAALESFAQQVHQAHHLEQMGSWRDCKRLVCREVVAALAEDAVR